MSNQEFEIAVKEPKLAHCDTVVSEAMVLYLRNKSADGLGDWYFFKTSVIEKLQKYLGQSEVLNRIINEKNNHPFNS